MQDIRPPGRNDDPPRVLLAEDDEDLRRLLANALRRVGCEVIEARDGADLLALISSFMLRARDGCPIDLVITDMRMPVATGLEVLQALREHDWATPVILITAFGDEATHAEALRLGAAAVLDKPFEIDHLQTTALYFIGGQGHSARDPSA